MRMIRNPIVELYALLDSQILTFHYFRYIVMPENIIFQIHFTLQTSVFAKNGQFIRMLKNSRSNAISCHFECKFKEMLGYD